MKVEYRRDIQNSYLVLITENQDDGKSYDIRMMMENRINGLLSCECKLMNNDILYYYDVTSKTSLEDICKERKIQGKEILFLLNRLLGILEKLEEFLLSEKSLCLSPQYIYIDKHMEQIDFSYVPGECWDFQVQLRELMEYLLPYLAHDNQEGMMIGYGLYHYVLREAFSIEGLHAQLNLYHDEKKEDISVVASEEIIESDLSVQKEEGVWQEIWDEDTEILKDEGMEKAYKFHYLCAFVALLWLLFGWILWRNFTDFLWIWVLMGSIFVGVSIAISVRGAKKKIATPLFENYKIEQIREVDEVDTQMLLPESSRKKYVLKNEKDTICLNNKDTYIIGRDKNLVDIVLTSTVVSRKHGEIQLRKNRCFLKDLYSTNGIRVNGKRLEEGEEMELFGGEWIEFADQRYYFQQEKSVDFLS